MCSSLCGHGGHTAAALLCCPHMTLAIITLQHMVHEVTWSLRRLEFKPLQFIQLDQSSSMLQDLAFFVHIRYVPAEILPSWGQWEAILPSCIHVYIHCYLRCCDDVPFIPSLCCISCCCSLKHPGQLRNDMVRPPMIDWFVDWPFIIQLSFLSWLLSGYVQEIMNCMTPILILIDLLIECPCWMLVPLQCPWLASFCSLSCLEQAAMQPLRQPLWAICTFQG